ncbi:hypothetical protein [Nevskia sp.]|uniref:hypothetical protein n=1 Tax=Nevskia sp. TaxID=1929292 RepID=UPI003F72C5C7
MPGPEAGGRTPGNGPSRRPSLRVLYFRRRPAVSNPNARPSPNARAGSGPANGTISMTTFLLLLGAAGIAVLIAYVSFCDRI